MIPAGRATLTDALLAAPREQPFLTTWCPGAAPEEQTVTWGRFLALAWGYRERFAAGDLAPGDRVIIVLPQDVRLLAAFAGALLGGQVPAILAYPTFKADPEKYRDGVVAVSRNLAARAVVLGDLPEAIAGLLRRAAPAVIEGAVPGAEPGAAHRPSGDDVAFIQHSAGTTGLQKGVALSHRAVLAQLRHLTAALEVSGEDRIVSWLPLYHDMGLVACFVLALACHLRLVLLSPVDWIVEPWSLFELASRHRASLCWLPNFAFQFLARRVPEDRRTGLDLSSLRAVVNCSEPVLKQSLDELAAAYEGCGLRREALLSSYAMAENTFAVTQSRVGQAPPMLTVDREMLRRDGAVDVVPDAHAAAVTLVSSGPCLPGNSVRIVGERDARLGEGRVGEILVSSDSLFGGYFNRPDLADRALRDGWYRTGDVGFVWGGNLYVLGRKDDVIIVGGGNLHPQDVEEAAGGHPDVHDGRAVAFGVRNTSLGTDDLVVVVEALSEEGLARRRQIELEVRKRVMDQLGVPPRVVCLVPPRWMVKSTAGKPARSTNRRKFLLEHPELNAEELGGR